MQLQCRGLDAGALILRCLSTDASAGNVVATAAFEDIEVFHNRRGWPSRLESSSREEYDRRANEAKQKVRLELSGVACQRMHGGGSTLQPAGHPSHDQRQGRSSLGNHVTAMSVVLRVNILNQRYAPTGSPD